MTPPVSESDGDTIFNAIQAFVPTIVDALTAIIAKKPSFDALIVADTLVSEDLVALNASTTAFEAALVAVAPVSILCCISRRRHITNENQQADLQSNASAIIATLNTAFASAIAAYA